MRAVRFEEFGGPEVLQIVEVDEPHAGPGEIRVAVRACGVNALDWKTREGLLGGDTPQSMGMEVAGVVDEVGDGVDAAAVGDRVFGPSTAGAAEFAVIGRWAEIPSSLDFAAAAALPVAVETAVRVLDLLEVASGQTVLINGGGGAVGAAAIQLAIGRGADVIVTASAGSHDRLRALGAAPTEYGDGLEDRVRDLAPGGVDRVFDMGPGGAMPVLVAIAGDASRIITISDFEGAQEAGVRASGGPGDPRRWEALGAAAELARRGALSVPVQQTFPLEDVAEAERISQGGHLTGKLVLLIDRPAG